MSLVVNKQYVLKTQTQNDYADYSFHALSRDETDF